jgi:hypothetical protein
MVEPTFKNFRDILHKPPSEEVAGMDAATAKFLNSSEALP